MTTKELNPMVRAIGPSRGHTCKLCRYLLAIEGNTRRYYKCQLRGVSNSAATDHRQSWNACAH